MKKGRFLLVVGALFMSVSAVLGQGDYAFKVLANKGTNEVKSGDTWVAVKTGVALRKDDELKLSENSYVGLVSSTGKPLELKSSGSYKVVDLLSKVQAGSSSVLNKYTDFILSSNSAEAKKNRLSATGAVSRKVDQNTVIFVSLPENNNADVFGSTAVINWNVKTGGPFVVTFRNMFDDVLKTIETPEKTTHVDLSAPEFAEAPVIMMEVSLKSDGKVKSKQYIFKKMAGAQADKVKKDLNEFSSQVTEETALNKFILAGFYEEKKLYIDAIAAYEQAIKMAPDVPSYKEAYEEFLLRNSLKEAAQ